VIAGSVARVRGCAFCAGSVWPAAEGGGPRGSLPPHSFKVLFKEGGIGTFYPLFYALAERARRLAAAPPPAPHVPVAAAAAPFGAPTLAQASADVQQLVHKA
jgi:hypothetical protein